MDVKEYLSAPPRVGFIESQSDYTIGQRVNQITYKGTCIRFPVEVEVSTAMVDFGGFTIACAVTSEVSISRLLPLNGFGSHCYHDEANVMKAAIATYCKDHGYEVCRETNSWPYAVAIITNFGKGFKGID
jgi:hypothetical protein